MTTSTPAASTAAPTAAPAATTTASTTASTQSAGRTRTRAPWTLHLAAVPMALIAAVSCVGILYFGTHDDPARPADAPQPGTWQAWCLIVILLAYAVTALAAVPGLYRRSRPAWQVALGYLAAQVLFGSMKFFGLGEDAALTFLLVDVVIAAALLSRPTRRWVGQL